MAVIASRDTVYETLFGKSYSQGGLDKEGDPSFEVFGAGSVDMYVSNNPNKPSSSTEMTLASSDLTAAIYGVAVRVKWIMFKTSTGTPVVYTEGLLATEV